jgi:zinc D-Ala-D-Ala carboxypeptidase
MNLSPHVTLQEFERSQTATRLGIPNKMNESQTANARLLCINVLEPIRSFYNSPIVISSGYRSNSLNSKIGGSSVSQHLKGQAADFTVVGKTVQQVFSDIVSGKIPNLEYDQVIEEGSWLHISFSQGNNRKQKLKATFKNGTVTYKTLA